MNVPELFEIVFGMFCIGVWLCKADGLLKYLFIASGLLIVLFALSRLGIVSVF